MLSCSLPTGQMRTNFLGTAQRSFSNDGDVDGDDDDSDSDDDDHDFLTSAYVP